MSKFVKLYIVDVEKSTYDRLESLFYSKPELGVKVHGYAHNFVSCINDMPRAKDAEVFLISAFLPDQMGIDLIPKIKDKNPNAKVIVMLQNNTRNLAEPSKEKGADEILQKPYKIKDLLDAIDRLVERDSVDVVETSPYREPEETPYSMNLTKESDSSRKTYEADFSFSHDGSEKEEKEPEYNAFDDYYNQSNVNQERDRERETFDTYLPGRTAGVYGKKNDGEEKDEDKPNEVVAFASTSAAGKTTMLVNIAAAIAEYSDYEPKICILDLNLMYPSVVLKFHGKELIDSKKNIFDLVEDMHYMDESLIRQALITHEPTRIQIMRTPSDIMRDFKILDSSSLEQLIHHLRKMFDLVLIDTSSSIKDEATMYSLMVADKVIVLTEPDIPNLIHAKRFFETLRDLEKDVTERIIPKLHYVLNKDNVKTGVDIDLVRKILGVNVSIQIPEDPNVTLASNNGSFLHEENTAVAKKVTELANIVYPFDKDLYLTDDKKRAKNRKKPGGNNNGSLFGTLLDKFKK